MSSSENNYAQVLNAMTLYLYKFIAPVFFILGNLGNILSAVLFARKSWRKNACVFYFNTCLLLNSACMNSSMLGTFFIHGYNINLQNSSAILCKLYYYVTFLFSTLLPAILISASLDRLLMTSENVQTRLYSSKRLAYLSVSICVLFWMIFNIHLLIKVDIQEFGSSNFVCFYDLSKTYVQFVAYASLFITFSFCVAMIILSKLAFKNVRRIRAVPRQERKQIRSMTKRDFQLIRCLFVHDIVYITCNIFLNVYYAYVVARMNEKKTSLEQTLSDFFFKILSFLQFIPYCSSFFIFLTVSKMFRNELKRMMGKRLTPMRQEENRPENVGRESAEINVVSAVVSP